MCIPFSSRTRRRDLEEDEPPGIGERGFTVGFTPREDGTTFLPHGFPESKGSRTRITSRPTYRSVASTAAVAKKDNYTNTRSQSDSDSAPPKYPQGSAPQTVATATQKNDISTINSSTSYTSVSDSQKEIKTSNEETKQSNEETKTSNEGTKTSTAACQTPPEDDILFLDTDDDDDGPEPTDCCK